MNDLTGKISKLLEDPEIMKSISGLSQMLQNDNSGSEPQNEEKNSENNSDDILSNFSIQPEMMDAILKIMPILSAGRPVLAIARFLARVAATSMGGRIGSRWSMRFGKRTLIRRTTDGQAVLINGH